MTDGQAGGGARSEWINVRNTGSLPLDWTLSVVNPKAQAPLAAEKLANFRFQLFSEQGIALGQVQTLGSLPIAATSGAYQTAGSGLAAGGTTRVEIRVWLSVDSGNEFQGAQATFDVVINAIQNGAPTRLPSAVESFQPSYLGAGDHGSCLIDSSDTVKCWGSTSWGRMGDGTFTEGFSAKQSQPTPQTLAVPAGVVPARVATSPSDTCILSTQQELFCVGYSDGSSTKTTKDGVLRKPANLGRVADVSVNGDKKCAVDAAGRVWCWGYNVNLLAGPYTPGETFVMTPRLIAGDLATREVTQVEVGAGGICALTRESSIYCWGDDVARRGLLGDGTVGKAYSAPVPADLSLVPEGDKLVRLEDGDGATTLCAVGASGTRYCWGEAGGGIDAAGKPISTSRPTPMRIPGHDHFETLTSTLSGLCLLDEGRVFCWGTQNVVELATGKSGGAYASPTMVGGLLADGNVVALQTKPYGGCAQLNDGRVACWGFGTYQAGDGRAATADISVPTNAALVLAKR
ncbi:RCC1 domain-containing protein [Amnibacterium flavum]|nr:hypothetical protein [Amnibacterium flavum]